MAFNNMDRKITALIAQKRNPQRINVFLDGEFAFGLHRITAAWLRVGEVLSEERITRLRSQDEQEVAYQRAFDLISRRPRAEKEIRDKLREKGFRTETIDAILERLRTAGLVGDAQFAQAWSENRSAFRPRGRRLLALELRQKGIGQETIEETLNELPAEETLAYEAAVKISRRLAELSWEEFRTKLCAHLLRKGFDYETATQVTRKVWQENCADESNL
jgi:regulatory protein